MNQRTTHAQWPLFAFAEFPALKKAKCCLHPPHGLVHTEQAGKKTSSPPRIIMMSDDFIT